jgi:hypothetical protein
MLFGLNGPVAQELATHRLNCTIGSLEGIIADKPKTARGSRLGIPHNFRGLCDLPECAKGIVQQLHKRSLGITRCRNIRAYQRS